MQRQLLLLTALICWLVFPSLAQPKKEHNLVFDSLGKRLGRSNPAREWMARGFDLAKRRKNKNVT
jgi:hypothetical protein